MSASHGMTREYAAVLRDIVGVVNPKYPPVQGMEEDTEEAFRIQKEQMKGKSVKSQSDMLNVTKAHENAMKRGEGLGKVKLELEEKEKEKKERKEKEMLPTGVLKAKLEEIYPPLKDVNLGTTRISILPRPTSPSDTTHGGALPPLSPPSISFIKDTIMPRDVAYETEWREARNKMLEEEDCEIGGPARWWERDASVPMSAEEMEKRRRMRLEVIWPSDGRAIREKRKRKMEVKL